MKHDWQRRQGCRVQSEDDRTKKGFMTNLPHGGGLRPAVNFRTEAKEPVDHFRPDEAVSNRSASGYFAVTDQGGGG